MSRHGRDFDRAQAAYDNQTPPEDEPTIECENCNGTGKIDTGFSDTELQCPDCKGKGELPIPHKQHDQEMLDNNDRMGDE